MADRVERLTNLLALLLETNEPLSLVEIAAGLDGATPAAVISRGTLPDCRPVSGRPSQVARLADDAGLASPALLVVGDVVAVGDQLASAVVSNRAAVAAS